MDYVLTQTIALNVQHSVKFSVGKQKLWHNLVIHDNSDKLTKLWTSVLFAFGEDNQ